jgi:Mrp family chromosome partitioning ATPase
VPERRLDQRRHAAIDGLDVIVSGPVPPDPSELLDSPTFATMGSRLLAAGYDHIVYDSPPALAVADPVIVAHVVEATIVVARAGRTSRESLQRAVANAAAIESGFSVCARVDRQVTLSCAAAQELPP